MRALFVMAAVLSVVVACEKSDRDRVRPCGYDDEESNDVPGQAWDFGHFADDPNSLRERTATIHTGNDVDWYRATVHRRALTTEPLVTIVAPAGFTVTAYHSCVGAGAPVDCIWGRPVTDEHGMGCESIEPNDDARLRRFDTESVIRAATHCKENQSNVLFRVSAQTQGECRKYDLRLEVE